MIILWSSAVHDGSNRTLDLVMPSSLIRTFDFYREFLTKSAVDMEKEFVLSPLMPWIYSFKNLRRGDEDSLSYDDAIQIANGHL